MTRIEKQPLPASHDPLGAAAATVIVIAMVAVRLVAAAFIPLSPDEAYYFDWSRFPAWSYYDHPPMGAWWIALGTWAFGSNPVGIRSVAVLSGLPISLTVYLTGRILFDRAIAVRAALWINATFLMAVGSILATPDAPSVLFWAAATLGLALLARTGKGGWWLLVGLGAGLGVISKLTNLFLGPAILLIFVVRRDFRKWLLSPWLWIGAALALAVTIPMLVWNAGHDWVTLTKQFGRLTHHGFDAGGPLTFLVTQFGVLNPLVAVFAGLGVVIAMRRRTAPRTGDIAWLLWTVLPLVAYMGVHAFQEQIQGNWLAPIFPTLALVAAVAAESTSPRWPLATLVLPVGIGAMILGLVAAINPGNLLPPQFDVGQVIRGWGHFSAEAERLRKQSGATWIAVDYYGAYGELAYHLASSGVPVIATSERARYAYAPPPDPALLGKPVLILIRGSGPAGRCFVNVTPVGTVHRQVGQTVYETYAAFRADGAAAGTFDPGCDRLP
jgi:4-amino-4-deoxy-L-arabinose transferase-like glycosyltransferase